MNLARGFHGQNPTWPHGLIPTGSQNLPFFGLIHMEAATFLISTMISGLLAVTRFKHLANVLWNCNVSFP